MTKMMAKAKREKERGMALLMALFALLLLSAIGLFMVLASTTETRIDANYSSSLRRYYAARSGLEEVRDRVKYPSSTPGGLADLLPQDVTGNAGGVLYVLNPASGETVDPTDPTSPYYDDQLCHAYASGVAAKDTKCSTLPGTPNWNLPVQYSIASATQLGYKWIRVNMKTNRIADPYFVDQTGTSAPLDTRVCWDGVTEQLSPGGTTPSCDANGMQTVYMLTSLAATAQTNTPTASRKMLSAEIVAPSIRPAGVVTVGAATTAPVLSSSSTIPSVAIDGRPHRIDGILIPTPATPPPSGSCSAIAPLATDSAAGTTQLEAALNLVRKAIVTQANNSCNADGSGMNNQICTTAAWWVRGTDTLSRFILSGSSTSTTTTTTSTSTSTPGGSGNGRGGRGEDDSHGGHHHSDPTGAPDPSGACDPTDPACFTNLDLAAPELFAMPSSGITSAHIPIVTLPSDTIAPFTGGKGNQSDASVYQPGTGSIINNEIASVISFVAANHSDPNYFMPSSTNLAPTYGSITTPAIVDFSDQTLSLQGGATLTGYGVLIVPNALEITNGTLNWTGLIVVKSPTGHVTLSNAQGSVNGALLLQPGSALNLQNSSTFRFTYSCEAIDLPFTSKPFKIISSTESSL